MTDLLLGFFTPWIVFAGIFALHLLLPARRVTGYVRDEDSGERLRYRLNGPLVLIVGIGIWVAAGLGGAVPWDWLWQHRWPGVAGAFTLGLLLSAAVVLSAPGRGGALLAELYLGRRHNPQMFNRRADAKMVLYLAGATLLQLHLLSFAAHHFLAYPDDPSPGVVLYVALFSWFVCDYLVFERVHLYTYDIFAERLGFKLVWGCLCWYPYFYAVGALVRGRSAESARADLAAHRLGADLLRGLGPGAGREHAEIRLQAGPATGLSGPAGAESPSRTESGMCSTAASGASRGMSTTWARS